MSKSNVKEFLIVMGTIFLMEMADKTQLGAVSFSEKTSRP